MLVSGTGNRGMHLFRRTRSCFHGQRCMSQYKALVGHFTSGDVAHCFAMADRDSSGGLSLSEWENVFGHIVTTQVLQQLFVIFTISRPNWKSADFRGGKSQESGRTGRAWLRSCVLARVGAYDVQVNDVNVFFCCCHCRVFRCVPGRSPV